MDHPPRIPLVQLARIAMHCPLADRNWGQGEKSWHCPRCNLVVHNFSAMTAAEADAALAAPGRVCAAYLPGPTGAPLTRDRPWALRMARLRRRLGRLALGLGLTTLLGGRLAGCRTEDRTLGQLLPLTADGHVLPRTTAGVIVMRPSPVDAVPQETLAPDERRPPLDAPNPAEPR